jgi:hypothetical protein
MKEFEILDTIKDIIFSVPGSMYKFEEPDDCFEGEWEEASEQEKAFLLIEEILLKLNGEKNNKKMQELNLNNSKTIEISCGPRFYSIGDENMFFEALNSVSKILNIKGENRGLCIYYKEEFNKEEKNFLKGLFRRYKIDIPNEFV